MNQQELEDVTKRLSAYLEKKDGYGPPEYLDSGGSAAVFKVSVGDQVRVIKVSAPRFLDGAAGEAERRRLSLQKQLIGHKCEELVSLFNVEEAEGTAFIEMEFVDWSQLKKVLTGVPDAEVPSLIEQLVRVVMFLEAQEIVHRDIKPENIHISPDFRRLKLLDLGVAREMQLPDEDAIIATDHGGNRPFLATAQYSPPEYLFRLDPPSLALWKGLSIYQVGAVLHDLITKKPLFATEVGLSNRWLLARAVLTKTPSFADSDPKRLVEVKALAARCLVKDLNTRLRLVDWSDFISANSTANPLASLKNRLNRRGGIGGQAVAAAAARIEFDREQFERRLRDGLKVNLIDACGTHFPPIVSPYEGGVPRQFAIHFQIVDGIAVKVLVRVEWLAELQEKTSNVSIAAVIERTNHDIPIDNMVFNVVNVATIGCDEDQVAFSASCSVADALQRGLELAESNPDVATCIGLDLAKIGKGEPAQ